MQDIVLTRVDKARQLLAEAKDVSQAKQVADLAHAAEIYAKRQKLSQESIEYAHAVKIDAMKLLGEMLQQTPKNKGTRLNGRDSLGGSRVEPPKNTAKLSDAGIGKKESSTAQKVARIATTSKPLFEEVRTGRKTVAQAEREVQRQEKREDLDRKAAAAPIVGQTWRLVHGDCLKVLPTIPANSARLVFADPPYNIGIDYGDGEKADKLPAKDYLAWCSKWVGLCIERLTPDGSLWVLIGDEYAAEYGVMLKAAGLTVRAWIKWYETFGVNQANNFNRCSRHLFYCVKDPKRFVFHASAVNRPSDRQTKYGDSRADPAGKVWDDVWMIPRLVGTAKERIPDFPTQLPLELLRPIVGCASDPGDTVIDPFSGSASSGIACVELGRQFVGIEKSPVYYETATKRLKAASR